jgi:hypothetical protein
MAAAPGPCPDDTITLIISMQGDTDTEVRVPVGSRMAQVLQLFAAYKGRQWTDLVLFTASPPRRVHPLDTPLVLDLTPGQRLVCTKFSPFQVRVRRVCVARATGGVYVCVDGLEACDVELVLESASCQSVCLRACVQVYMHPWLYLCLCLRPAPHLPLVSVLSRTTRSTVTLGSRCRAMCSGCTSIPSCSPGPLC